MDADQRARLIRDLDSLAREITPKASRMERLFRDLADAEDVLMGTNDAMYAGNALPEMTRQLPELTRIFGKWARLLDGPAPRLAIRSTDEPERLGIIARYPSGDLDVGYAERDGGWWRIRLTDPETGDRRAGIGTSGDSVDDLLDAVNRHMDDHGPWWAREKGRDNG
jgi:hypothetical protein